MVLVQPQVRQREKPDSVARSANGQRNGISHVSLKISTTSCFSDQIQITQLCVRSLRLSYQGCARAKAKRSRDRRRRAREPRAEVRPTHRVGDDGFLRVLDEGERMPRRICRHCGLRLDVAHEENCGSRVVQCAACGACMTSLRRKGGGGGRGECRSTWRLKFE